MSPDFSYISLCYWNRCSCSHLGPTSGIALLGQVLLLCLSRTLVRGKHSSLLLLPALPSPMLIFPPAHPPLEMLLGAFSPSIPQQPNSANGEFCLALPTWQQQEQGREKREETTCCKRHPWRKKARLLIWKIRRLFAIEISYQNMSCFAVAHNCLSHQG